jgi:small subunit ribosomal protein S17|tara:strand:- start:1388 stop:1663 length:276 start_codon:yes stop_codon:yes gene_type:complete
MKSKKPETKISLHGRTFSGTVTSRKMHKTAKVEWARNHLIKKYERYEKRKSSVMAHIPDDIEVKEGDKVIVKECRPLSKTKHFIVIKNESN